MTISKLSDVADALSQLFAPKLARQFNFSAVTASKLPTESGQGKNVAWDVEMDGAVAGSYAEGADMASGEFEVNTLLPATLSWGHYRSGFHVSETELDAAASSSGSASAILQLLNERVMGSAAKLASQINQDIWSGDGTDGSGNANIVGLHGGALDTSGTYATIARGSYPLWESNVLENGGVDRPLTVDLLEHMDQQIFEASGSSANLILVSPAVWRKYSGLFESIRRVPGDAAGRYDTGVQDDMLFFKGIPVVRDKDAPAKSLTFLNTDHVKKVFLPHTAQARADVFKTQMFDGAGSNGEDLRQPLALPFAMKPLAKNGDSLRFMIKVVCQLKVTRPNSCGRISDVSVA